MAAAPHKACHLVSPATAAEIPFVMIMRDPFHLRAFGLDVKLNGRNSRFEIDTGAGGLVVTQSVAKHAELKAFSQTEVSGLGDQGFKPAYTAYADSIRIGNLEFQDCAVRVLDSREPFGGGRRPDRDGRVCAFSGDAGLPHAQAVAWSFAAAPGRGCRSPVLKTSAVDQDDSSATAEPAKAAQQDKLVAQPGVTAQSGVPAPAQNAAAPPAAAHGPYDRYVAPEMKDYTPVYRVGHELILPAAIDNGKLKLFLLDTGAFATTISPQAAREVTKVRSDYYTQVKGISGNVEKVYSADEITFHFAHLSQKVNGVVSLDTSRMSKDAGMEISGFFGATTLNLLTMHIDYRDGLVKFDYDPKRGYRF